MSLYCVSQARFSNVCITIIDVVAGIQREQQIWHKWGGGVSTGGVSEHTGLHGLLHSGLGL